jgi:HKD family nuclease
VTVDFLEFLKKGKGKFAFVATYEFDPHFFERRILSTPAFDGASVLVFVDNDRYRDILETGRQGQEFDRNYFVIPISRASGVFHPKLYLTIGDKKAIASIGSNNCTSAGTGHNFELISTLESSSGDNRSANTQLIPSIFRQFQRYAQEAGPVSKWLKKDIFDQVAAAYPWLSDTGGGDGGQDIELLSSHDSPLWSQVVARLAGTDIRKVALLAPFFDKNLRMVERIRALWPAATIQIVSQSGYSNLPIERFVALRDTLGNIELISATSQKAGRKMHAKALAFQTPACTYWLAGSANMSNAALAGGNSEACLWFTTKQTAAQALKQDDLTFAPIDPEDFEVAAIDEPAPPAEEAHGLKLHSLVLTDEGQLLAAAALPAQIAGLTLRIFKRDETLPTFSWKIDPAKTDITLSLNDDDQAKFDRPAVGQLQGVIDGRKVKSLLCSVKQLPRLLRDRAGGNSAGNRLQRVMESGDGLIEYADALDGIDSAIDFMNNTTIRFNDDTSSDGGGGRRWRSRDPFSGDIPDHWAIGSSGGSVTELRDAIWAFVQRHIQKRLERHADRGNLGGLENFLDIYRSVSRVLLAWHNRRIHDEIVIPAPYVTTGLQEILATLIGARGEEQAEVPGFGKAILANLSADEDLVRAELNRHRVPAIISATIDEIIRVRAIARKRPIYDEWSQGRRDWVSSWIDEMQLVLPSEADLQEIGAEFRLAA